MTAEEFFRNKLKELQPFKEVITLNNEMITAEQGMRWAHELKQLHLHNVSGQLGFDEGYKKGYNDATKEACDEIAKNYQPNCR